MTNKLQKPEITNLVEQILAGTIEESEKGTILKTLQIQMASSLISNQSKLTANLAKVTQRFDAISERFDQVIEAEMEGLEAEDMWKWIQRFQTMQLSVVDLQRKIAQGKNLFETTTLSEEERMVTKVLSSFKSVDEKKKFIEVVKVTLEKNEADAGFED